MSSKRRLRRKECDGKTRYESYDKARDALYAMKRDKDDHSRMSVYKCSFCHKYHYGHTPTRVKRGMDNR